MFAHRDQTLPNRNWWWTAHPAAH
ncbi:trp operon leader peptide [Streptomyces sp. NPDC001985]